VVPLERLDDALAALRARLRGYFGEEATS
jgi:hypothetical protein